LKQHRKEVLIKVDRETGETTIGKSETVEEPQVFEEIVVEELSIDGVCGVY
jgi:mycofactocin precursor